MQHFPYSAGQQALSSTGVEATALSKKDQLMSSLEKAVRGEAFNREVEQITESKCQSIKISESQIRASYHPNSYYDDEAIRRLVPKLCIGGSDVKVGWMETPSSKVRNVVRTRINSPNKNSVVCATDCLLKTHTISLLKEVVTRSECYLFQTAKGVIERPELKSHDSSISEINVFSDQSGNVILKAGFQILFSVSSKKDDIDVDVQIESENTLQMHDKKDHVDMKCTNKSQLKLVEGGDAFLKKGMKLPKKMEMK